MTDFNDLIFKFKERLKVLNRSPSTITAYTMHLKAFLNAVAVKDIKKITRETIEAYIVTLYDYRDDKGKPYTLSTIGLKIRSIKRFFEFMECANIVFINPAESIKEPKKERRLPRNILSNEEVRRILDRPNLGTLTGIRDRAVLEVFYSTGARMEELCHLTIYDADLQGGLLRINKDKGAKDRVVPLGKHAVRFLREYISKIRPRLTKKNRSSRHLFVSRYGGPLNRYAVSPMIRTCAREAGIKKPVSAHTFRHTFATGLIRNGADIRAVQKMMGHSSLRTTQDYIRMAGVDLKKEHQKSHPRERDKETREAIKPVIPRKPNDHKRTD